MGESNRRTIGLRDGIKNTVFILFIGLLFLAGCFDKDVFSKVEDLSIIGKTPASAQVVGDTYGIIGIKNDADSNIELRIKKVVASCSTERSRSLGSDFDGYILIEIYKNGRFAAKAQMDFKTEPTKKDYEKVWGGLCKNLKWKI